MNLYAFVLNSPAMAEDLLGLEITVWREGKALAHVRILNDTIEALAKKIGLGADEYLKWLSLYKGGKYPYTKDEKIPCQFFKVPNTIAAYRTKSKDPTKPMPKDWGKNIQYLKTLGFKVDETDWYSDIDILTSAPVPTFQIDAKLKALGQVKELHGFFYNGHGSISPFTGLPTLVHLGASQIDTSVKLKYKLGFTFIVGCKAKAFEEPLKADSSAAFFHYSSWVNIGYIIENKFEAGKQATNKPN